MKKRSSGFTLLEILVVIAIIGILAAILFPVATNCGSQSKKAATISNVKQLALAALLYANDHEEAIPHDQGPRFSPSVLADTLPRDDATDQSNRFDGAPIIPLYSPYAKSREIWYSSADAKTIPENGRGTTFQANAYCFVNTISDPERPQKGMLTLPMIAAPPRTMVFGTYFNQGKGTINGGVVRVAWDGHAKWMPARRFGSPIQLKWWAE